MRIVSESFEPFLDRQQAGHLLGWEFPGLHRAGAVVLGFPDASLVVAHALASVLGAELDVMLARKLRAPSEEAVALGSVPEGGDVIIDPTVVEELRVPKSYVDVERELQEREMLRHASWLRRIRPKVPLKDRTVIVADECITTGGSMLAAVWAVRQENPKAVLVGIPVGPRDAVDLIAQEADWTVCLKSPQRVLPSEQFYVERDRVDDEEIVGMLMERRSGDGPRQTGRPKVRRPARYLLKQVFARCFL